MSLTFLIPTLNTKMSHKMRNQFSTADCTYFDSINRKLTTDRWITDFLIFTVREKNWFPKIAFNSTHSTYVASIHSTCICMLTITIHVTYMEWTDWKRSFWELTFFSYCRTGWCKRTSLKHSENIDLNKLNM